MKRDRGAARAALVIAAATFGLAGIGATAAWSLGAFGEGDGGQAAAGSGAVTTAGTTTAPTSSTSTTSTTTTSTTTTTTTTTAPPPPKPAATQPPAASGTVSGCSSYSAGSINNLRAGLGLAPLGTMSNANACAWAKKLAAQGSLSHGMADCGWQVVGYYGRSAPGGEDSAPSRIINGWFNSGPHYAILTNASLSSIGLAFVTVTKPDGSWRVYGVGNLC